MRWEFLVLCVGALGLGCASTVTGAPAARLGDQGQAGSSEARSSPVLVRSRVLPHLSAPGLPVVEVSFQNRSRQWQRLTAVGLETSNPALREQLTIPLGDELYGWQLATQQREAVRAANEQTAWELVLAGAWLAAKVGSGSSDARVRLGSAAVGLGATSAFVVKHYQDRRRDAETPALVPPSHLLAGPIAVPPGAVVKRWVLLSAPERNRSTELGLVLSYEGPSTSRERVLLSTKPAGRPLCRAGRR